MTQLTQHQWSMEMLNMSTVPKSGFNFEII